MKLLIHQKLKNNYAHVWAQTSKYAHTDPDASVEKWNKPNLVLKNI